MGNNQAFTSFEYTTLLLYNRGILDKELLSEIMEQYRGMDIDRGGMVGTLSNDGLDVIGVVLKVFGVEIPKPGFPEGDYHTWPEIKQEESDRYYEHQSEAFYKITDQFGWA